MQNKIPQILMGLVIMTMLSGVFVLREGMTYPLQIKILDEQEITHLSNKELLDKYIDAVVELEAMRTFHQTSGFRPQDYQDFKRLLRYKILLLDEIRKRDLTPPATGN